MRRKTLFSRISQLLLFLCVWAPLIGQARETQPNVLMISVDDWNDWVGAMGDEQIHSPNLDRLASQGVLFNYAHCSAVYCAPSRTSVMTGQYPSTNGCYTNELHFVADPESIDLPGWFKKHGYSTHGGGKLYHHMPGYIDIRSWDEYFIWNEDHRAIGWPLKAWGEGSPIPDSLPVSDIGKRVYERNGFKKLPTSYMDFGPIANERENEMADTIVTKWTVEFLKKKHKKPFFIGYGLYAPHKPNFVPQKYFDLYPLETIQLPPWNQDDLDDLPPNLKKRALNAKGFMHDPMLETGSAKKQIQAYLAACSYADTMIGRVLDALEASQYAENTIVVLWSDHGTHHGEKLRWMKHTLWERNSNVPMIWAGPGIAKGRPCNDTASLVDIYKTLIELCNLPQKDDLDGISLVTHLANPEKLTGRSVLQVKEKTVSVINTDWRYTRYFDGEEELYELKNDPHEWHNLAENKQFDGVKIRLQKHLPVLFADPAIKPWKDIRLVFEGDQFRWVKKGN